MDDAQANQGRADATSRQRELTVETANQTDSGQRQRPCSCGRNETDCFYVDAYVVLYDNT